MSKSGQEMERLFFKLHNLVKTGQFDRNELNFMYTYMTKLAEATKKMLDKTGENNGD